MKRLAVLLATTACTLMAHAAPPTQTVFKCVKDGKTVYTDEPCLNGQPIDATPTRGMDTSTGKRRIGADVARDMQREAMADALKPLTGMNREQLDRAGRRTRLTPPAQQECKQLDVAIPRTQDPSELLRLRQRYKQLGCE